MRVRYRGIGGEGTRDSQEFQFCVSRGICGQQWRICDHRYFDAAIWWDSLHAAKVVDAERKDSACACGCVSDRGRARGTNQLVDGVPGKLTMAAVHKLQADYGLPEGDCAGDTWYYLIA